MASSNAAHAPGRAASPQDEVHTQQYFHWQHYRANRVKEGTAELDAPAGAAVRSKKIRFQDGATEAVTYGFDPTERRNLGPEYG